jgi:hypothetical protein
MNKTRFIEVAPIYYALAIFVHFKKRGGVAYRYEIENDFTLETENDVEYLLEKGPVFDKAIEWLADLKVIDPLLDDFGPAIYKMTDTADQTWEQLAGDRSLPFYKYSSVRNENNWLNSALGKLNATYDELQILAIDFENPEAEWEPLPLDRDDKNLQAAIASLDEVIRQVRSDNGYSATLPEERDYVLTGLGNTLQTLKESTSTSVAYLKRYALEPIGILLQRFKSAAIAIAASAAKEALIDFLKEHGVKFLNLLFK